MDGAVKQQKKVTELKTGFIFDVMYSQRSDYAKAQKFIEQHEDAILDFLDDPLYKSYMVSFCNKYYDTFIEPLQLVSGNIVLTDDNYRFFFELIQREFDVTPVVILASLMTMKKELDYKQYSHYVGSHHTTLDSLVDKSLLHDLKYDTPLNLAHIKRKLQDLSITYKVRWSESLDTKILTAYNHFYHQRQLKMYASLILADEKILDMHKALRHHVLNTIFKDEFQISFDTNDYHLGLKDCLRDNKYDTYYKDVMGDLLIQTFGGCAKCGEVKMGETTLAYDHFWLPKDLSGNFAMRSKSGHYVNNCIPLCTSCNISKGKKSVYEAFTPTELDRILAKSQSLNGALNMRFKDFEDPDFPHRDL